MIHHMSNRCFHKQILISTWWLLLLCGTLPSLSQTVITGRVTNKSSKGLPDISVMLMLPADSTIVDYSFTDEKGNYKLSYKGNSSHLLITISAFDIKRKTKRVENKSQTVNLTTEEGSVALREVVVKPTKMWGEKDTINYSVAAFKDKKDIVIGDVLKKMPGINVKESGQITYKGKPINKFYIENLDMLQGRYSIATNNISANDIATVQVLENHQPIKALEKTDFSNDAAINLKIKEGKKHIFGMTAMLGLGVDKSLLWQEEITGMYFAKERQHLFTCKTNNNGTDANKELRSFTANNPIGELQMTDVQQPSPPSIRFERYNFNTSHAATANNLFKSKNDAEVSANLIYYNNEDRRHSFARTSYVLPGEAEKIIEEDIAARNRTNNIETEFRYNLNKDRNYFNNYLNVSGSWDDVSGEVNTRQSIGQRLDNKSFFANNVTHWIKRGENEKGVELMLQNAYRTQPHHLRITPGLYPNLINAGKEYTALLQNVRYNAFVSNNRFSFLSAAVIGNVQINPTANVNVEHQTLRSDMETADNNNVIHPVLNAEMRNDIAWTHINAGISLNSTYNGDNLKISFFMPVTYKHTAISNQQTNSKTLNVGKFYFQPLLSVRYTFTNQLEANGAAGYYTRMPGLALLYTGYILQNYRSINRYDTQLFDSNSLLASFGLSYKNILDMFFASGGISFNRYHSEGMYAQTFDGLLSVTQVAMQPNGGNSFSVSGRVSKGFDWKALVFSADASYGKSTSEQMRQNKLVNYKSQWTNTSASVNLKPFRWLNTEYKVSWGRSRGKVSSGESFKAIQSLTQRAVIDISLPFSINLNGSLEHYYNSAIQGDKNFSLADLGLTYVNRGVRYSLEWTNIFNTGKYISASYGALNSYYSEYEIRPMAVMLKVKFKLL
ncbi:carboxypeptidase-like regulatory domain-containing protein [Porphyromonas macacae]|uniref:carboxypeptidase-like regulatory domain-containing protein n=1 Tax=Porphyromonas macacae TaxID=28115 RepID=UPI001F3E8D67|nr:carboxypeptidase-like regulatory domain-containing protein [Porphyromonas macacae]